MMRREKRGGELNLIQVLRHDLPDKPQANDNTTPKRFVVIVLAAVAAVLTAIQVFLH